jgi:transposase
VCAIDEKPVSKALVLAESDDSWQAVHGAKLKYEKSEWSPVAHHVDESQSVSLAEQE